MDRQYKVRNYLKNETFTLLNINRGNWKWFRLEKILNKNDMKKASWFNHIISLDRIYKVRNYLKNETFTFFNMNWGNLKWFRLNTIIKKNDMKKHRDLTILQASIENTRLENLFKMYHLPFLTWVEVTESDSG